MPRPKPIPPHPNPLSFSGCTAPAARLRLHGQVLHVEDGDTDLASLQAAIESAKRDLNRPTLIKTTTVIGYGSSKQGTAGVHGAPLGHADLAAVKKAYGFEEDGMFAVPTDVSAAYAKCKVAGARVHAEWKTLFESYRKAHPDLAKEFERCACSSSACSRVEGEASVQFQCLLFFFACRRPRSPTSHILLRVRFLLLSPPPSIHPSNPAVRHFRPSSIPHPAIPQAPKRRAAREVARLAPAVDPRG